MTSLNKIDFRDTINYRHRSDLCMGIKSLLLAATTCNIEKIDVSDNFLDVDGGRAFQAFLEKNKTLKTLNVNNCSLGHKAIEQIVEALDKNKYMQLVDF